MINLEQYSYSVRNSYISLTKQSNNLLFRNVGNGDEDLCTLFKIDLIKNSIDEITVDLKAIKISSAKGTAFIKFSAIDSILIDTEFKLELDFEPQKYEFASKLSDSLLAINLYSKRSKLMLASSKPINVSQKWNVISSEDLKVSIEPGLSKLTLSNNNFSNASFELLSDECVDFEADFKQFWNLEVVDYSTKLFEAMYILWSGFVYAKGNLKYDACYMSMNIMTNIWSWDNCFVSLGLAKEQPHRAFEQFMSFEHVQAKEGNYPDFMNPDYVSYDFTKPPVQGVLYLELLKENPNYFGNAERLRAVYKTCQGLLKYWMEYRTFNEQFELPFNTHGNDTGLDNATIFDNTVTVRSPDLMVYLLKLVELLKYCEERLGEVVRDYTEIEQKLLIEITERMYIDGKYISYDVFTNEYNKDSMSIIELTPLLIFDKLPNEQQAMLLVNLKNFLTEYGIASESQYSKYYQANGYWRGPIWAPTTCLCYIGLEKNELPEAELVRRRYVQMCEQHGFAENFNALSGEVLSDKGFAWTAAVYKYFKEHDE